MPSSRQRTSDGPISSRTRSRYRIEGNVAMLPVTNRRSRQSTAENVAEPNRIRRRTNRRRTRQIFVEREDTIRNFRRFDNVINQPFDHLERTLERHEELHLRPILSNIFHSHNQTENTTAENDNPFRCCVCQGPYFEREPTVTSCGHIYCRACIHRSLHFSDRCVKCQSVINPAILIRAYF